MAARKPQLRAVSPGEKPVRARPKTVSEAADTGSTRDLLVAMRTRIARAVEDPDTPARDLAALTKRLVEVVRDIEAIDSREDEAESSGELPDEDFDAAAI
jgi:ribosome-binding protein aMBF1 (putative translation factor)